MSIETLELTKPDEHILQVKLNRPDSHNAIDSTMAHDLDELWHALSHSDDGIRCVILTGLGKTFCPGWGAEDAPTEACNAALKQAALSMLNCPIPIIAAVNGPALGNGLDLVLLSDFAYACRSAHFCTSNESAQDTYMISEQLLPQAIGSRRAKQLLLTGENFSTKQACEWGLVNQVTTAKALLDEVLAVAQQIVNHNQSKPNEMHDDAISAA